MRSIRGIVARDGGRPAIAVVMACLTLVAAVLGALQADAGTAGARSSRQADVWALERTGLDATNVVGGLRDGNVFRQWFALLQEAAWARGETTSEGADLRQVLARVDEELAAWARERSPLLQAPYFDERLGVDFNGYLADRASAGLRATEMARVENEAAGAWASKAASYVTALTIIAVALFFLGLAASIEARARRVLIVSGLALGALAIGWALVLRLNGVHRIAEAAVDAVVASEVALQRAGSGEPSLLTDTTRAVYVTAIADAERAVALDGGYVSGHRAAAVANLYFANARIFSPEGLDEETAALVGRSIAAFEQALAIDDSDPNLWWDLAVARYLGGDMAGSIAASDEVIARSPDQFSPYVNRAVAMLAAGQRELAFASFEEAIGVAGSTNIDSTAFFLARVDAELARLAVLRPSEAEDLLSMQRRLREATVAMRVLGTTTPPSGQPAIAGLEASGLGLQPDGTFAELGRIVDGGFVDRAGLQALRIRIAGQTGLAGRHVSIRAWTNDRPDAGFDQDLVAASDSLTVDLVDPYGRAGFPLTPGRWLIEVYVDGRTDASWSFEVSASEG
jgi:tetratricopeptide (TPR) repeat protein